MRSPQTSDPDTRWFDATVVFPRDDGGPELLRNLFSTLRELHSDYAVLKIGSNELFDTAPIYAGTENSLPDGTEVKLASIPPENYPHFHTFTWSDRYPSDIFQQGHSGSPILYQGQVFTLIAGEFHFRSHTFAWGRQPVHKIRAELAKEGLDFVLKPRPNCSKSPASSADRSNVGPH